MLKLVGLGLRCAHLSDAVISSLKSSDGVYVDTYTSLYQEDPVKCLRSRGIEAIGVGRDFLEGEEPLSLASKRKISIAVIGHPLVATTHHVLILEAHKRGISWEVVDNVSAIEVARAKSGLSTYRFGKIVTVMYPREGVSYIESVRRVISENDRLNLHTILLLETGYDKTMRANEAAELILKEYPELADRKVIAMARLGWDDEKIVALTLDELRKRDLGEPPHLIVVPSPSLHPVEEEWLAMLEQPH